MQYVLRSTYCIFLFLAVLLSACAPAVTPTYFIPPTAPKTEPTLVQTEATVVAFSTSTSLPLDSNETPTLEATSSPEPTPTMTCANNLKFVEDITIPDGMVIPAGESFVKQWRIQNDGDCDWDSSYLLKLVSGDALGAPAQVALYPARAGAEAVIEMTLIAPLDAGLYHTVWQAFASDGSAFEQAIYVEIVVE